MKKFNLNWVFVATLSLLFICCQENGNQKTSEADGELPVSTESEEAMNNFNEGLAHWDENNGQKARASFDKALEADPEFVSAQMYRTFTANSAKDFGDQRDKLLAMRDNANEAEVILMDYVEANMADDDMKELEMMKKLVEKFPNSPRAHVFLGGAYDGIEEYEEGRAHYQKAVEIDADNLLAITSLGFSYMFFEPIDFKEAEKYMAKAVELTPNSSRAHINLGDAYRAQNNLEGALKSYTKAAELDPEDEVAFSKAGHANSFLGNYEAARKNYQDSRAVSEFGTGSFNFEGFTHIYEGGNYEKALDFFQEVIAEVDNMDIPESNKTGTKAGMHFNSAMIAMHHEDVDRLNAIVQSWKPLAQQIAKDIGTETAEINQRANMQYWEGVALALEGKYEEAVAKSEEIKTTLEPIKDPHKLRGYNRLHAIVNYKQGNYDKALEHMAGFDEANVYDKYWMAKANMEVGNTEEAMEMMEELSTYNFNSVGYALIRSDVLALLESQSV